MGLKEQLAKKQEQEQPKVGEQPVETERERLIRETEEAELTLKHRKATKLLNECQDCEATKIANQELASSLAEREGELARQVEACNANTLTLQTLGEKAKEQADTILEREKIVDRNEKQQKKADNYVANLAKCMKADSLSQWLRVIERALIAGLPKGVYSGGVVKPAPEIVAFKKLEQLLTEGIEGGN